MKQFCRELATLAPAVGARFAGRLYGLATLATAIMALWPALAMLQRAQQYDVALSLHEYLANALRFNVGGPYPERTVEYGTAADGTKLLLDVWRTDKVPAGTLRPAFVRVHGGGWTHGARSGLGDWNSWLNALGYDVFDVEYRMPPPERWRDEIGDVKCALGWLVANAAKYDVDTARISVTGYSAGGNLALLAAYSVGDPDLPPSCDVPGVPVRSVVNIYGPSDLGLLYRSSGSLEYAQDSLNQYVGGSPTEYPERYKALSPVSHVGTATPPTITFLGGSDRIVRTEQAEVLHQALTKAGVVNEVYFLPANDHGFDFNWGGFGTQVARAKIEQFLARQR